MRNVSLVKVLESGADLPSYSLTLKLGQGRACRNNGGEIPIFNKFHDQYQEPRCLLMLDEFDNMWLQNKS